MPVISYQKQISQQQLKGPRQSGGAYSPEAFGSATGQALQKAGLGLSQGAEGLFDAALEEQEQQRKTRARDAANQLRTKIRERENADAQKLGKNGVSVYTDAKTWTLGVQSEMEQLIPDKKTREMYFDPAADRLIQGHLDWAAAHSRQQEMAYEDETRLNEIKNLQSEVLQRPGDPEFVALRIAGIKLQVHELAQRKGLSPEGTKQVMAEEVATAHAGVITRLVDRSPEAAKGYLDAHREELGSRLDALSDLVDEKLQDVRVDRAYTVLHGEFSGPNGVDYGAALAALAKPETRKRLGLTFKEAETLTNAMEGRRSTVLAIREQKREDARNSGFKQIMELHEKGDTLGALRVLRNLPGVSPTTALSLENALRKPMQAWTTDPQAYRNLIEDVRDGRITRQSEILSLVGDKLTPQDAEKAVGFLDLLQKPEGEMVKKAVKTLDEAINGGLLAQKTPATTKAFQAAYMDLMQAVDKARKDGTDVRDLLTPGGKDYVLDKLIQGHRVSIQDQVRSMAPASGVEPSTLANLDPATVKAPEGMPPEQVREVLQRLSEGKTVRVQKDGVVRELVFRDGRLEFSN